MRAGAALIDIVPADEEGPAGGTSSTGGANLDHLCLRIEPFDAAAMTKHFAAHGVSCGEEKSRYGAEGRGPSVYLTDPEGNGVELKGPPGALIMGLSLTWRALRLSLMAMMIAACSADIGGPDVVGDFQIDYGYGVETLRLSSDSNYLQAFRKADEDNWTTNSGVWELRNGPRPEVKLHNAMQVDDGSGKLRAGYQEPVPGDWSLPVRKGLGTVSLVVNEARGQVMSKLEPVPVTDQKPTIIRLPSSNDIEVK